MTRQLLHCLILLVLLGTLSCTTSSPDSNAEQTRNIVTEFFHGFWNGENIDIANDLLAQDAKQYPLSRSFQEVTVSPSEAVQQIEAFRNLYTNLHYEIDDMIVEGNKAMIRATGSYLHDKPHPVGKGEIAEPTGKTISYTVFFIFHVEDGKITKLWVSDDFRARHEQMLSDN